MQLNSSSLRRRDLSFLEITPGGLGEGERFLFMFWMGKVKAKVIPVTGHGGPQGCETSRLPHFL
jgi:hypothetical protein